MESLNIEGQTDYYKGKVRDVYFIQGQLVAMVASDRISAFDVILPKTIPFKGQILNQVAAFMLNHTKEVCPNWLLDVPAPNVSIGKMCKPYKVEMVIRGNLSGHAWRTYKSGKRTLCGVSLPDGLSENDYLPEPVITPSTKAAEGHDEDISKEAIIAQNIVSRDEYEQLEKYTRSLFEAGTAYAKTRGLVLADTKYEFGNNHGAIYLIDEVHTPDSSRYFYADDFDENQKAGKKQKQLSKEFVREWLVANNFMGKEGQQVPDMSDDWVATIQNRYIELYEKLLGKKFVGEPVDSFGIAQKINAAAKKIMASQNK